MVAPEVPRPLIADGERYVPAESGTGTPCVGGPHDGGALRGERSSDPARVLKAVKARPAVRDLASAVEAEGAPAVLYYATDAQYPRGAEVIGAYVLNEDRGVYEWIA